MARYISCPPINGERDQDEHNGDRLSTTAGQHCSLTSIFEKCALSAESGNFPRAKQATDAPPTTSLIADRTRLLMQLEQNLGDRICIAA